MTFLVFLMVLLIATTSSAWSFLSTTPPIRLDSRQSQSQRSALLKLSPSNSEEGSSSENVDHLQWKDENVSSRRSLLVTGATLLAGTSLLGGPLVPSAQAAVGTLPEFQNTNAILQGLTVNVADPSQQKSMVEFLVNGFGFEVLRQRINGPIEETVCSNMIVYVVVSVNSDIVLDLMYLFFCHSSGWDLVPRNWPFLKTLKFQFRGLPNTEDMPPSVFGMIPKPIRFSIERGMQLLVIILLFFKVRMNNMNRVV